MYSFINAFKNFFERRLTHSYLRTISILIIAIYLVALAFAFASSSKGRTGFGTYLGADFGAFYIAGKIFNQYSPAQIYDANLHDRLYREEFPETPPDSHLPYVNAPFFILPFTLLARLPYTLAYLIWLIISLGLYVAGLLVIRRSLTAIPQATWSTALLLSLSFMPFLVECLAGGQTSAAGFFFVAAAINFETNRKEFLSGLVLSVCAYKPTLLVLILPMLVITGRYRTLIGFVAGAGILTLVSLLATGWQGGMAYLNSLLYFTKASADSISVFRSWKYVDVNSFFRLLLGDLQLLRWTMTIVVFVIVLPLLIRVWWRERREENQQHLIWSLTLTWTFVLNLYVGIYDTTLVVLSVLLLIDYIYRRNRVEQGARGSGKQPAVLEPTLTFLLVLLYLTPWITQPLARLIHIQLFTIFLAMFGIYQIRLLTRLRLSR